MCSNAYPSQVLGIDGKLEEARLMFVSSRFASFLSLTAVKQSTVAHFTDFLFLYYFGYMPSSPGIEIQP